MRWEAKGIEATPHEVRRQVCGFANSHDGGYLIIGADQVADGSWTLDGVPFRDEPPIWIANVVGAGVSPYPDGLDTRSWPTNDDRMVAVVHIPPIATPPCNANGTVWERVSGKTIAVREPLRLAAMFARGDQARHDAEAKAKRAAVGAMARGVSHPAHDNDQYTQFGLGLAAAGYLPDISSRLFGPALEQGAYSTIETVLIRRGGPPRGTEMIVPDVAQDSRSFEVRGGDRLLGGSWQLRATWDGAVGIYWLQGVTTARVESIVRGPVREAWVAAEEMLAMLGAQGPRYLQLTNAGAIFPPNPSRIPPRRLPIVGRGPLDPDVNDTVLASIERELQRVVGVLAYEPE